jgi:quinol-cytochrome oxidoreductase complex cytochrome b subunit
MFYYRPAVEHAYHDMKDLEFAVSFGIFLRNMHRWAAHAMVITVILHMTRVFLTGSYKSPREFNWSVGVILLVLTLLLSFTGYLLPWDQLAIWAITVGTNMASAVPILGAEGPFSLVSVYNDVRFFLLGGTTVGQNALLRFYVLHCIGLPLVAGIFMIVHFWRIRKDGFSGPPLKSGVQEERIDVWPNLIQREYVATIITLIVLIAWSILVNAPLEELANPNRTPNPAKAPWYFVGLQELLVYFDPWIAGVMIPGVIIFGLITIPYIDPNPGGAGVWGFKERRFAVTIYSIGIAMWFILIFIGLFARGPNWAWYWPWENWDIHKPPPGTMTNVPPPVGGALLIAYFFGSLVILRRFFRNMGWIKYAIMMVMLLMMVGILLKVGLHLVFNVKYVFSLLKFDFNI